ncbi:glycosyltransferase family 4 protein [Streptomyces sp. 4N509B]|uniref:glycosyltransferase family 4 protein n=1 Tax=Streptomyces sp. 4N509B TaxID=3457413 RepID=UPI003FD1CFE1
MSSPAPGHGRAPQHVVQLLGGGSAGTGAHVRSLSAGLVARGLRVTVCAPPSAERRHDLSRAGATFVPVTARSRLAAVGLLRVVCADADLVHAHGMRVGLLASLALRGRRVPLVVTWHTRPALRGLHAQLRRVSELWVARAATVVLGATSDLVERARSRGARDARLAPVVLPAPRSPLDHQDRHVASAHKLRAELGAVDRPLLVTAVRIEPDGDPAPLETLLAAARAWRGMSPQPLLVVAGEGSRRAAVRRRVEREELPVRLLGRGEDVTRLVGVADVVVFAARWAAQAPLAQEAMRCGVPLVATAVGGVPDLVGDAAVLVPYGDAVALGRAVAALLADPERRAALAEAGRGRAGSWPTEDTTVAQVLSVYDELAPST